MSPVRIGSVCTGYGGLDVAVQEVFGGSLAWVADNDPGASRILAHHYPRVPNLGDITAVRWEDVEPVDILCGGYPCQPFSTAGKRKGTADDRHIWPYIACALRVLRPRYAVFENVAGHLSLGFDTVLADLAALGFDAEWCVVRADQVGAAHQRKRLFILARLADARRAGLARRWPEGAASDGGIPAAHAVDLGGDRGRARGAGRDEPAARRLAAADAACVGEREPADQAQSLAGSGQAWQEPGRGGGGAAATADRNGREEQQRSEPGLGTRGDPDGCGPQRWGPYAAAIERWAQVIGRPAPRPTDDLGRLNPPFVEWLMGLDNGHVTAVPDLSRTAQLKALGNGVLPQQAIAALRLMTSSTEQGQGHSAGVAA
ncbi:DNA cytosine methyltransferase [Streptomyces sp. NPDC059679]|uniref:DNA cytosine methyltransferase n=1 Tax=Streptomyces sp. NPDC059679 TaxID=3346903 RepID=UPI0036AB2473